MFGNTIGRRVWKAVKAKIAAAQKRYEDECFRLDEICEEEIEMSRNNCENQKVFLADELVKEIIG